MSWRLQHRLNEIDSNRDDMLYDKEKVSPRQSKRNQASKVIMKSQRPTNRQLRVENLDMEESIKDQPHYRRRLRMSSGLRNESVDGSDDILYI